jgi:hypothetical protein
MRRRGLLESRTFTVRSCHESRPRRRRGVFTLRFTSDAPPSVEVVVQRPSATPRRARTARSASSS